MSYPLVPRARRKNFGVLEDAKEIRECCRVEVYGQFDRVPDTRYAHPQSSAEEIKRNAASWQKICGAWATLRAHARSHMRVLKLPRNMKVWI